MEESESSDVELRIQSLKDLGISVFICKVYVILQVEEFQHIIHWIAGFYYKTERLNKQIPCQGSKYD